MVKRKFGLNPLLVCCTYPPEQKEDQKFIKFNQFGFNVLITGPSPETYKNT